MVAQAIEADVKRIVESLSGVYKTTGITRYLCLMQLKYWLTEKNEDDLAIFRQAYADFASISVVAAISSRLAKAKKAQQELLPSKAMGDLLLEDAYIRRMFDQSFTRAKSLSFLQPVRERGGPSCAVWVRQIASINHFTELCVRLHRYDEDSYKTKAAKMYGFAAARNGSTLARDVEPLRSARRQRLAFLFVAARFYEDLLECPEKPSQLWNLLHRQASDSTRFKKFFASCAFVQNALTHGRQLSGDKIAEWAGVKPAPPFRIKPIAASDITTASEWYDNKEGV